MVCVSPNGEQFNLNFRNTLGDAMSAADVQKFATNLARTGAILVTQQGPQETGYWNPVVVTDEQGVATLTLTVPEQSTAWKINAKGITADTLAGEAELDIVAKKDLFGELKLPLAFTDGDDAEIIVSVHHDLKKDEKSNIRATLRTIIGGRTIEEKRDVAVSGGGMQELTFKTSIRRRQRPERAGDVNPPMADTSKKQGNQPDANNKKDDKKGTDDNAATNDALPADVIAFELVVENGDQQDKIRRVVPIRPFGVPVYVTASGTASSDTTAWVEPNPEMPLQSPEPADHCRPHGRAKSVGHRSGLGPRMPDRHAHGRLGPRRGHQRLDGRRRAAEASRRNARQARAAGPSPRRAHPHRAQPTDLRRN